MAPDSQPQQTEALERAATWLVQNGLQVPTQLMLDALAPLDFLNTQVALFVQPFTNRSRWDLLTRALTQEQGWAELRRLLAATDRRSDDPVNDQADERVND